MSDGKEKKPKKKVVAVKGTFIDLLGASVSGNPAPKPKPQTKSKEK